MVERFLQPGEARPSCCVDGERVGANWYETKLSNGRFVAYCTAHAFDIDVEQFPFHDRIVGHDRYPAKPVQIHCNNQ